jgi:TB2/DP1, HVA22 family
MLQQPPVQACATLAAPSAPAKQYQPGMQEALESSGSLDDSQWLTYWLLSSLITIFERFGAVVLFRIPFYAELKLALLCWLVLPMTNGAKQLYEMGRPHLVELYNATRKNAQEATGKEEDAGARLQRVSHPAPAAYDARCSCARCHCVSGAVARRAERCAQWRVNRAREQPLSGVTICMRTSQAQCRVCLSFSTLASCLRSAEAPLAFTLSCSTLHTPHTPVPRPSEKVLATAITTSQRWHHDVTAASALQSSRRCGRASATRASRSPTASMGSTRASALARPTRASSRGSWRSSTRSRCSRWWPEGQKQGAAPAAHRCAHARQPPD